MLRAFTHMFLGVLMLMASSGWVVVQADCSPQGCCCAMVADQEDMDMKCCPQPETVVVEKTVDVLAQFDHHVDVNLYDEGIEVTYLCQNSNLLSPQIHSQYIEIPPPDNRDIQAEIQSYLI